MKLTNTNIETIVPSHSGGAAEVGGVAGNDARGPAAKTGTSDSVNLSSGSQLLALAKANAASDRSAKVASVAVLVRKGQYETDTASVSRAVVQGHIS